MKIKRLAPIALLAPLMLFAACASTPSLTLSANWYSNTTNSNLTDTYEELRYVVTFQPENNNARFTVSYDAGTYTAVLKAENIAEAGGTLGYHLHTETSITGRYILNGQRGDDFTDTVVSDVWFLGLTDRLRPIRSEKEVYNTTPNMQATSVKGAGILYHYSYVAEYPYGSGAPGSTTITVRDLTIDGEPQQTKLTLKGGGDFLDNEQILFALRGLDLTSSFSFRTVNPSRRQAMTISPLSTNSDAEQFSTNFSMKVGDAEAVTVDKVNASRVTIGYSGGNSGRSQTYVYARCVNAEENTYRNVLLHMETYALNSLGTFMCDLTEAVFNEK